MTAVNGTHTRKAIDSKTIRSRSGPTNAGTDAARQSLFLGEVSWPAEKYFDGQIAGAKRKATAKMSESEGGLARSRGDGLVTRLPPRADWLQPGTCRLSPQSRESGDSLAGTALRFGDNFFPSVLLSSQHSSLISTHSHSHSHSHSNTSSKPHVCKQWIRVYDHTTLHSPPRTRSVLAPGLRRLHSPRICTAYVHISSRPTPPGPTHIH